MSIAINKEEGKTACRCDRCLSTVTTDHPDGVVPEGWMTGQLWLDVSISQQSQTPLVFCPVCAPIITGAVTIVIDGLN